MIGSDPLPHFPTMALPYRSAALAALLGVTIAASVAVPAQAPMAYVYNAPESAQDQRYLYQWEILRTALERTRAEYGAYTMTPAPRMTERRQALELEQASGRITVMYLGTIPEYERTLRPIRIPVDRNLGGYSLFLIRRGEQARFDAVRTLDDLRPFSFGLGQGWIDVDILRASRLRVVTGSNYEGLFEMLVHRRFDVFLRAAVEVLDEVRQRQPQLPDLEIERNLVLYYPLPMYFWFSKTAEGERLAARAEKGMRAMYADGTYLRIFDQYQRQKVLDLHLSTRRLIAIDNPFLRPETPFADRRLWFDPRSSR